MSAMIDPISELSPPATTVADPLPASTDLPPPQKAAIILGILGPEAAGPILEQMSEASLRSFARAMSKLRRVRPDTVRKTVNEFLEELELVDETVEGGVAQAREILQDYIAEATLSRIFDDLEVPAAAKIWKQLGSVDELALAEFLSREHPQTAAVVLSKLSSDHGARLLANLDAEQARDILLGLTKTSTLDPNVVEAIGTSLNKDFLAHQRQGDETFKPEERIGSIMNYATGEIRHAVLSYLDETQPELSEAVKAKMFTFQDIPTRVDRRDIAAVVRATDQEALLKALAGAVENAPETQEFMLSNISSRVAEQLREELEELGKVKIREAEEAQNVVVMAIRELESAGEFKTDRPR